MEYLRRGIEEIPFGAAFVFARDEDRFSRYPHLRISSRRRRADDKVEEKVDKTEEEAPETPEQPSTDVPPAPDQELPMTMGLDFPGECWETPISHLFLNSLIYRC